MLNRLRKTFSIGNFSPFGSPTSRKKDLLKSPDSDHVESSNSHTLQTDGSAAIHSSRLSNTLVVANSSTMIPPPVPREAWGTPPASSTHTLPLRNSNDNIIISSPSNSDSYWSARSSILQRGHNFIIMDNPKITFCDQCLQATDIQVQRCTECHLTCHTECCRHIAIECKPIILNSQQQTPPINDSSSFMDGTLTLKSFHTATTTNSATLSSGLSFDYIESNTQSLTTEPSFVKLLHETMHAVNLHRASSLSDMRSVSAAAITTPYDLSTNDGASLKRFNITIKVVDSHEQLSTPSSITTTTTSEGEKGKVNDVQALMNKVSPFYPMSILKENQITSNGLHFSDNKTHWNLTEIQRRVDVYKGNAYDLTIHLEEMENEYKCSGTIRVNIMLIRTVRLASASFRPLSTFDFVSDNQNNNVDGDDGGGGAGANDSKPVWLPRGIAKLLYIDIAMTTEQVIQALLSKFQIKDNPKKFALYEHTIEGDREVRVRKLQDKECPLLLVLTWAASNSEDFNAILLVKRLVLQENETNDIDWNAFSVPELNNFLSILQREEDDYKKQTKEKYFAQRQNLQQEIQRRERLSSSSTTTTTTAVTMEPSNESHA